MAAAGFEIHGGGYRAEIAVMGAGLRFLEFEDRALTETWELGTKPPLASGAVLAPWPNRIRDGHFRFDGIDHQLELTEQAANNAIHGFVRHIEWDLVSESDDRVELTVPVGLHKGWPYPLQLTVVYSLDADGLKVEYHAVNTGSIDAPFGLGAHPYLRVGDVPLDECTLRLSAGTRLPLDPDRMLPNGTSEAVHDTEYDFTEHRSLRGIVLDAPFSALDADPDGRCRHELRASDGTTTTLWTSRAFGWLQVFTADPGIGKGYPGRGRAVAMEPMTCPPNAFNSGIDQIVLAPGGTWSGEWGVTAST